MHSGFWEGRSWCILTPLTTPCSNGLLGYVGHRDGMQALAVGVTWSRLGHTSRRAVLFPCCALLLGDGSLPVTPPMSGLAFPAAQ